MSRAEGDEADTGMKAALRGVAISGAVLTVGALIGFDARAGLGVGIGAAIATANLFVMQRIGRAFLERKGNTAPWAVIAVVKLLALLGGLWLIMRRGFVSPVALVVGYGALPIGITLGSLFGPKPPDPEPAPPEDPDPGRDVVDAGADPAAGSPSAEPSLNDDDEAKR
jgi:hypothetical protein